MGEAGLQTQRNIYVLKYLDQDWREHFDDKNDAIDYFQNLNHYANLLSVSKDQKEEFIETKAYDELSPEDIDDWINNFGSMSEAVSYAENKLRNNGLEKGETGNWDLKVETAIDWALDDMHSQKNPKSYPKIILEDLEKGYNEFIAYERQRGTDAEILWNGPIMDVER